MDYFCTCGRGTEPFLVKELSSLLPISIEKVSTRDGKVFFSIEANHSSTLPQSLDKRKLLELKTCERLFVSVVQECRVSANSFQRVQRQVSAILRHLDTSDWTRCEEAWLELQQSPPTDPVPQVLEERVCLNDEQGTRKRKIEASEMTSFRVSAKCSGTAARHISPQSLARLVGPIISRQTGWRIELRRPIFEIYVQLNHEGLVIGIPVTNLPLSRRSYLLYSELRTTVAACIVSLANIQAGMLVLDPMCGQGTILIEAAKSCTGCTLCGCDIDVSQCLKTAENISFSRESHRISVLQASVTSLPLPDSRFDAVLCDIPFGINHGTVSENKNLYPYIVSTINRLVKRRGRVVLLVGAELKNFLLAIVESLNDNASTPPIVESLNDNASAPPIVESLNDNASTPPIVESLNDNASTLPTSPCDATGESKKVNDDDDTGENLCQHTSETETVVSQCRPNKPSSPQVLSSGPGDVLSASARHNIEQGMIVGDSQQDVDKLESKQSDGVDTPSNCNQNNCPAQVEENNGIQTVPCSLFDHRDHGHVEGNKTQALGMPLGWITQLVHYVKLGETDAYICCFEKQ